MLWQAPLSADEIEDILNRIGRIDEALERHPFHEWLISGLDADFRPEAVEFGLRMLAEGEVDAYIRYANDSFDDAINWDR